MAKSLEERVQALEDREAIATLQARYIDFNDGGWSGPTHHNPTGVAELFTADGVWELPRNSLRAQGHDEIVGLFNAFQVIPFIVHQIMNPIIEIDGDRAHGEWHAIIASTTPDGQALWTFGKYLTDVLRTEGGWKYTLLTFDSAAVTTYGRGWAVEQFIDKEAASAHYNGNGE